MKHSAAQTHRSGCPINLTLELFGDPWSLLIVRDMMFYGRNSYKDFLKAGEGIATNILANRLQRLEQMGICEKLADSADARRFLYRLTQKGIDLAPILVEMVLWGVKHDIPFGAPEERAQLIQTVEMIQADREGFIRKLRQRWEAGLGRKPPKGDMAHQDNP